MRLGREPAIPQPADPNAEIRAVAGHSRDESAALYAVGRVGHCLASSHHRIQHAERVVAQRLDNRGRGRPIRCGSGDVGGQIFGEENRTGFVAIVAFVAHMQRLGQQGADVQPAGRFDGRGQDRSQHVVHPS